MSMNWKRGSLRLWCCLSGCWVLVVSWYHYKTVYSPYQRALAQVACFKAQKLEPNNGIDCLAGGLMFDSLIPVRSLIENWILDAISFPAVSLVLGLTVCWIVNGFSNRSAGYNTTVPNPFPHEITSGNVPVDTYGSAITPSNVERDHTGYIELTRKFFMMKIDLKWSYIAILNTIFILYGFFISPILSFYSMKGIYLFLGKIAGSTAVPWFLGLLVTIILSGVMKIFGKPAEFSQRLRVYTGAMLVLSLIGEILDH